MAKVIFRGIKKDGKPDFDLKSTPVLITELIGDLHGMCEAELIKRLGEIRESAEKDDWIRKMYARNLKEERQKHEGIIPKEEEHNGVKLSPVTEKVKDVPAVGTKVLFLPDPVGVEEGTVSAVWTDGEEYYVTVNEWNPDVKYHVSKLIWEVEDDSH